jgi:hypothetical protein
VTVGFRVSRHNVLRCFISHGCEEMRFSKAPVILNENIVAADLLTLERVRG